MKTTRNTPPHVLPGGMLAITLLAGLFLLGALPHAVAQNFGSAISLGSTGGDAGNAIARDAAGNLYVAGGFNGTVDFDPGTGVVNLTSAGKADIFVAKYAPNGALIWAKGMGGTDGEGASAIAVDASGNVLTTGSFSGTVDLDPGPGTANLTSAGFYNIFVSKLDSSGNFVWAKRIGTVGWHYGNGIAVDAFGNVLTTGSFTYETDFDPGPAVVYLQAGSSGESNIFVSKLDSSGSFVWARRLGGSNASSQGFDIAVDSFGNVLTTGSFAGTADFDPGAGTFSLTSAGNNDIFVSKLNSSGSFIWAKRMGGPALTSYDGDAGCALAVDGFGNVHTTGMFEGTVDFDPGAGTFNLTSAGAHDIFVSKLDSNGNFVWARGMGGTSADQPSDIVVDAFGNVLTTGHFIGAGDFDPGAATYTLSTAYGYLEMFVSKLDSSGNFVWARRMGGLGHTYGSGIAADPASVNVFTTGFFNAGGDYDPGPGTVYLNPAGDDDIFVSWLTDPTPRSDFNGDNKPDLIWRHDSGAICAWFMDGINYLSGSFFNPA
jgi:hypothetical protein